MNFQRMQSDLELDTEEERREELATASLATLNNITFYREPSIPSDPLDSLFDDLCRGKLEDFFITSHDVLNFVTFSKSYT